MTTTKEIRSLTGIRGIAALYVALYHSLQVHTASDTSMLQDFVNRGYISVDLFFVLSGFVMTLSSKKYFEDKLRLSEYFSFMKKRFARLYPMYLLLITFAFIFVNHFSGKINFFVGLTMLSILLPTPFVMYHLWSLSAEWVAYLIFPILVKICYKSSSSFWVFCIFFLSIILRTYAIILSDLEMSGNEAILIPKIPSIIRCISDYMLGIVAFQTVRKWPLVLKYQNAISIVSFICIITLLFFPNTDLVVVVLFVPLIISISTDKSVVGKLMSSRIIYFFGLISYSLYLLHALFLELFMQDFYMKYNTIPYSTLIFNTIYFLVIILVSYFCYKVIEIPMQRQLNKKRYFSFFTGYITRKFKLKYD